MYRCLSSLADIDHFGYSSRAERLLSGGQRKFPPQLTFNRQDVIEFRMAEAEHMSISGVQDKVSLKLKRGKLEPTDREGEYILKPVPGADIPQLKEDVPANEHLTMQIASQVFGMQTAVNACIYFADGELAYITKRFDRSDDGAKIGQEDFCQLSNRTEETAGRNYKYDATYEEVGRILGKYCRAYAVESEKLYKRIVFNYVFSNGDAHLKNFSLYQSSFGDYLLTPAYDLLCTSMHFPRESRTALDLFDDFETESFRRNGYCRRPDFLELAERYDLNAGRANAVLSSFHEKKVQVLDLIGRSFMSEEAKTEYRKRFEDRLSALAG